MPLKITFLITVDISEPPADGISLKEKEKTTPQHNSRPRIHSRRKSTVHKLLLIEALNSHCYSPVLSKHLSHINQLDPT